MWFYTERPGWAVAIARVGTMIDTVRSAGSQLRLRSAEIMQDVIMIVRERLTDREEAGEPPWRDASRVRPASSRRSRR